MSDRETQPGSIIPGVDWESGVKRLMGNEQLYRKLLAKFAASYGDAAGRIRDALSAGDRQTAHNELHTLKGVTANLSLAPLADLVLAAEQAVKHDDTEHENECIDAMSRELDAVIKALSKLYQFDLYDKYKPSPELSGEGSLFFFSLSLSLSSCLSIAFTK